MYTPHTSCRACGYASPGAHGIKSNQTEALVPVFDLGLQPLANDFAGPYDEVSGYAPLKVLWCPRCTLGQLSATVRPDILYRNYHYVTSPSQTMERHFGSLAQLLEREETGRRMLEIGSNDGRMLRFFASRGWQVTGIDPADNLAEVARKSGVPTISGLFDTATATEANEISGPFDVVMARHVFCHVNHWREFIKHLSIVTHKESLVCIEAPYACDMLSRGEFDTIYHEHTSYLTIHAVEALLEGSPFRLYRVEHYPIHGGALLVMLQRVDSSKLPHPSIQSWLETERAGREDWLRFADKSHRNINALRDFVFQASREGKRVVGLGASAKCSVWVNACGFRRQQLNFVSDTTALKQWKLVPGSDIPVVDEHAILRELPDYVIVFCWNFREEVLAKNSEVMQKGVRFVFPVPELEIVSASQKA